MPAPVLVRDRPVPLSVPESPRVPVVVATLRLLFSATGTVTLCVPAEEIVEAEPLLSRVRPLAESLPTV